MNLPLRRILIVATTVFVAMIWVTRGFAANGLNQEINQEGFLPKSHKGPVVVVISGQDGVANYRGFAAQVAGLGYFTVLIDGKAILTPQQDGAQNLRTVIYKAQGSDKAVAGKVAVIGLSQGGGGVLAYAVAMPDIISMAVVYYPATSWIKEPHGVVNRIRLPILVLAGEKDRYINCCLSSP
jgi:dienelactone hydrolase